MYPNLQLVYIQNLLLILHIQEFYIIMLYSRIFQNFLFISPSLVWQNECICCHCSPAITTIASRNVAALKTMKIFWYQQKSVNEVRGSISTVLNRLWLNAGALNYRGNKVLALNICCKPDLLLCLLLYFNRQLYFMSKITDIKCFTRCLPYSTWWCWKPAML